MASPGGGGPTALSNSYIKICNDIGCQPMPELLHALTTGQRFCSISSPNESLPDGTVISLCAVLPMAPFEMCSFHNLNLSTNSWAAIADACSKTRPLQRLVFRDCAFRDGQGLSVFSRALSQADLHSLELVNCQLSDEFMGGLTEGSLLGNEQFHTLRLSGCGLGDAAVVWLARAIEKVGMSCALKLLDLSHNRIGDPGACALAGMLAGDASRSSLPLITLELEENQVTDLGGVALCRAAKAALMLQRLNLSANPALTSATMLALAEAVRFNTGTLTEVALAGCRANEDAAVTLLRAANKNNTLQMLDIRGVPLGKEGVNQLCALLRYTTCLNTLRVDVASAEGAEAIARDLPANRSLMHITLGGPVPESLLTTMSEILAANTVRRIQGSPVASSPIIHAWIEDSTNAYQQHAAGAASAGSPMRASYPGPTTYSNSFAPQPTASGSPVQPQETRSRPSSPSPPHAEFVRSPRSDAGGSVYSHATHRTGRTHRTHRTSTSYLSLGGLTDLSRRTVMVGSTHLRVSASLAAGGAAERAVVMFRKHDQNEDNYLNKQEMLAALEEMGVLNGIKAKHIGRFLDSEFKKADWDKDGRISLHDFISYYEKIAYYQAQMAREGRIKSMHNLNKQMVPQGTEHNAHLKRVFKNYARLAIGQGRVYADGLPQMNSAQFHRLCQDAGFMEPDGRLSTTAVDVIFTRYRAANSRRMAFKDFISALAAVAYEMGFQFDDIMEALGAKTQQPLAPVETVRDSLSEPGGVQYLHPQQQQQQQQVQNQQQHAANVPSDPSFEVPGVHLATVHERGRRGAAKGKTSSKGSGPAGAVRTSISAGGRSSGGAIGGGGGRGANGQSTVNNNPLYDSQDYSANTGGAPFQSSFNLNHALGGQGHNAARVRSPGYLSPGRNAAGAGGGGGGGHHGGPPPSDLAVLEARLRLDMESLSRQLEERLDRQVASMASRSMSGGLSTSSGGLGGLPASADALLGAKLRQLEGQVSGLTSRQDEADRVAAQLAGLQDIMNKLAEEMVRIKNRADTAASTAASAVAAAAAGGAGGAATGGLSADVEERLGSVVSQLDGLQEHVKSMDGRVEALGRQVKDTVSAVEGMAKDTTAQMAALEKKVQGRLSRYDGALLQVAKQVDFLDQKIRENREEDMKVIEMLLEAAGTGVAAGGATAGGGGEGGAAGEGRQGGAGQES